MSALVAAMLGASTAQAGAWTREAGGAYTKLAIDAWQGADYQDPLTGLDTDLRYRGVQTSMYGEVGLVKAWPVQVMLQVPVVGGTLFFEDARLGLDGLVNPRPDAWTRQGLSAGLSGWAGLGRGLSLEARLAVDVWADAAPRGAGGGLALSWTRE